MDIFKIVGFSILALFLIITIKNERKDIAMLLSLTAGIILLILSMNGLESIITMINSLIDSSGINREFFTIIIKVIGISYLIEFARNICIDSGESSLASKLELAGKVIIVTMSLPLVSSLVSSLSSIV